ncbi:MAG TPA: hypothetical protein VF457_17890 [Burkholderiaceae bacterium]
MPTPARTPSWLDAALCSYLALPVLIFCGWFRWPVAVVLGLLTLVGWRAAMAGIRWREAWPSAKGAAAVLAIALAWTAFAGGGHFVYANADWYTRSAVLRDLVAAPWPPAYRLDPALILRAPVGFYLPSALAGMLVGVRGADIVLYAWSALGFALFLAAAASLFERPAHKRLACLLVTFFGGLDMVGYLLMQGHWPAVGEHIQWWMQLVQYSSEVTLMFWVPNHALPAWLGTMLVLRLWRTPTLARVAPLCAAAVPLWSPLAAIGLAPFFVAGIAWRRDWRLLLSPQSSLAWIVVALPVAVYLTLDSATIPAGWLFSYFPSAVLFLRVYVLFCMLQFGLLALVLYRLKADSPLLRLAVAILLLLPLYRFGLSNDLPMRASIPALTVLALACVEPLLGNGERRWRAVLAGLLVAGLGPSVQEIERTLIKPREPQPMYSMAELYGGPAGRLDLLPPHYVARPDGTRLGALLRPPALVPPSVVPEPAKVTR